MTTRPDGRQNEDGKCRIFLHHSSVPYAAGPAAGPAAVTEAEVLAAQKLWADSIASISKVYAEKGDYVAAGKELKDPPAPFSADDPTLEDAPRAYVECHPRPADERAGRR